MKRVLCIYLPKWPLQRLLREQTGLRGKPVALVQQAAGRGALVVLASIQAARLGIQAGMPLAEAIALHPQLAVIEEDGERDWEALKQLATWAERYSPLVGFEEGERPSSLLLDVAAGAVYFQGEAALLEQAQRELDTERWVSRLAIADTIGAAWALAHHGRTPCAARALETAQQLRLLPVAALRLPAPVLGTLRGLGIECIAQLLGLPRASIPARLGPAVLLRLDQALGEMPEVFIPHRLLPEIQAVESFDYGLDRLEIVQAALDGLLERIAGMLEERGLGLRQLECWIHQETTAPVRLEIACLQPTRSVQHVRSLLDTHLEQLRTEEPIQTIRLRVTNAEPVGTSQLELFETESVQRAMLTKLVDRLSNRLGCETVTRPTLVADAQPEYACRLEPLVTPKMRGTRQKKPKSGGKPAPSAGTPESFRLRRPVRLCPRPEAIEAVSIVPDGPPISFCWNEEEYRVERSWGPERIETGWWRADEIQRDYYIVATHCGNRFWIFRRRDNGQWFLQGCFD